MAIVRQRREMSDTVNYVCPFCQTRPCVEGIEGGFDGSQNRTTGERREVIVKGGLLPSFSGPRRD